MDRHGWSVWIVAAALLMTAGCGDESASTTAPAGECGTPSGIESAGSATPFEDVEEYLTGFRITEETEGEDPPDDPNFGGVWGDRAGGMIVALVDCTDVDLDEVVRRGGGSDAVTIIQVDASAGDVQRAVVALYDELIASTAEGFIQVDATGEGQIITVKVADLDALPSGFGSTVTVDFDVVETDDLPREGG